MFLAKIVARMIDATPLTGFPVYISFILWLLFEFRNSFDLL